MQLVSAYLPFQTAIAWAVDNFRALSNWHASARRVAGLIQSMRDLDRDLDNPAKSAIKMDESGDGRIHANGLTITNREGDVVISNIDLTIEPGEKIMLTGESGTGKSALGRTLAGLWPWGVGSVQLPKNTRLSFIAQRAYLPLGSLRDTLRYPLERLDADDAVIAEVMGRCGIGHLVPRLDDIERWDQVLSNGERQRLAFARLLLQRPTIVILDDALGALGDESQTEIMELLRADLRDTTLVSVAQHGGLERFHDRTLTLVKAPGGAKFKV
jgi:putative ATP-binding cassette transporter